jgi:hypothetical protein
MIAAAIRARGKAGANVGKTDEAAAAENKAR